MKVQLAWPQLVLGVIISMFLALGTVIAIKVPAYEASDEPDHVQNIEALASGHWYSLTPHCRLTTRTVFTCTNGDEAQQAPLYYLLFAGWQVIIRQPVQVPFNQAIALPVRAHAERYAKHSAATHRFLLWLRLPNILLGALTVLLAYFAVRLVTADVWSPVIAASLVAFLPRFVFLSSFVTNDNLVNVLGALFVFLAVRYALSPSRWRMASVGAVFGLLMLTKLSALPIAIAIVVLALMAKGWRQRGVRCLWVWISARHLWLVFDPEHCSLRSTTGANGLQSLPRPHRWPRNVWHAVSRIGSARSRGRPSAPSDSGFILVSVRMESVPLVDAGQPGDHRRIRRGGSRADPQESVTQDNRDVLDDCLVRVAVRLGCCVPNGHLPGSLRLRRSHSNLRLGSSWA